MKEWKIDSRTSEEIIGQIGQIASNYTPEWNFNVNDPDIGSALAVVYADMLEGTIAQFNRAGYKNQLSFFNELGAQLKPSVPARGHVVFEIAEDAPEGIEIDAGTAMTADLEDGDEPTVQYETAEDIYVTPARPSCFYMTDGAKDRIYRLCEDLKRQEEALVLFREKGENLQSHELYLFHEEVLEIFGETYIEISFFAHRGKLLEKKILEILADPEIARFSYWSDGGWQDLPEVSVFQEHLLLHKKKEQPAFAKAEFRDKQSYVLRCRILDIHKAEKISVEEIKIRSRADQLKPEYIYGASVECDQQEYFPFGQSLTPFEEVYFGSKEVLGKRGAEITLNFHIDFVPIPLETNLEEDPIEWKWIMKRSDFKPNPEFDVSIEEVIWEYFNGNGWSRLFSGKEYSDIFGIRGGMLSQQKKITFTCPADMMPILVNSCETCYIRARILKINNFYKLKGQYIVPVLGNTCFSYSYPGAGKETKNIGISNNLEKVLLTREEFQKREEDLFQGLKESEKSLYLGFEKAPKGAPVRMLFLLEEPILGERGSICWEYRSEKGWKEMNLADETCSLSRPGLVTFVGPEDFLKTSCFGEEKYWIRLRDAGDFYKENQSGKRYPVLKSLWMNAVEIRHMEQKETEWFTLDEIEESCCLHLMHGNIDRILVEIQEEETYTMWKEVEDLETVTADSRVYQADRSNGIIYFGNGNHGMLPPLNRTDAIRVSYRCGGGSHANVGAGQVNKLNQTLGFVTGVYNPESLWGGLDTETPKEALRRCSARLRHWDRAVTARDYEELAMEASRVLKKVRCFGGRNEEGEKEPGAVTLVILPEGDQMDKSQITSIQESIRQYLIPRMDPGIVTRKQFYVTGPKLVEVKVMAEVVIKSFQEVFQVRRRVQEQISRFLDPMNGHFDGNGWAIGQFPGAMQLRNAIKEIPEIVQIRKVYLVALVNGPKGRQEVDPEIIAKHPYILPVSGNHEIIVNVQEN